MKTGSKIAIAVAAAGVCGGAIGGAYLIFGGPGVAAPVALIDAQTSGTLKTAAIDPATITKLTQTENFSLKPDFRNGYDATIFKGSRQVIVLSDKIAVADLGASGNSVVGAPGGHSFVQVGASLNQAITDTRISFSGTGNIYDLVFEGFGDGAGTTPMSGNTTITGYVAGADVMLLPAIDIFQVKNDASAAVVMLKPDKSAPVDGAGLDFKTKAYVLYAGDVGDGSAAAAAAAVEAIYKPTGRNGDENASHIADAVAENLTVIGETAAGDAVVYQWAQWGCLGHKFVVPLTSPADANGHVDPAKLTLLVRLVGVRASALTAADFH